MRKSHAAGWAPDSPTPAQLKEFFGQIDTGKITKDSLQAFLRGDFAQPCLLTEAEQMVAEILGPSRAFGYQDICRTWRTDIPGTEPAMLFTEDVLRECAEANASGEANWRFSYVTGLNLRSQREFIGWNRKKQPCFDPEWTWWLNCEQDGWAKTPIEPGYRLYDFTKRYSSLHWDTQNQRIGDDLGDQFERAEEQAVAEICFSTFYQNKGERLLPNWYHWGRLQTAGGNRVYVGRFGRYGFDVCNGWGGYPGDILGVVVSRKSKAA